MKMILRFCIVTLSLLFSSNVLAQVHSLISAADAAYAQKNWAEYGRIYQELAKQSPENGEFWYRLGISHRNSGKNEAALEAYGRAYALGYQKAYSALRIASLEAARNNNDAACNWFETARRLHLINAEQELLQDKYLAKLAQNPLYRERVWPMLAAEKDRLAKWQADLRFFDQRLRETHWSLFEQVDKARWESEILSLQNDLQHLQDWQIKMRLNQLVRLGNSGHSLVLPEFEGKDAFHMAKIQISRFADGWYIKSVASEHAHLLGKKVVKIGSAAQGVAPEIALHAMRSALPHDSITGLRFVGATMMVIPEFLVYFGYQQQREQISLSLETASGKIEQHTLAAQALNGEALQKYLMPSWVPQDWLSVGDKANAPYWLRHTELPFWFAPLQNEELVYFQFNQVRDGAESLADFSQRLAKLLAQDSVKGLVIDMRLNNGGNGQLLEPLLQALSRQEKLQQPGRLYVLIGGKTFSAASLFIADLEQRLPVIFVGETSGSGPMHLGENNMILLPNSHTKILAASRLFVRSFSDDYRAGIAPHIQAALSFDDLKNNHDPALAAVLKDWQARR